MKKKVITALGLIFMVISILWLVSFAATNSEAYIPSETSTETEEVMTLNEQGLPIAGVETVFAMQRTATLEEKQPEIIKLETKYFERIESTSKEELENNVPYMSLLLLFVNLGRQSRNCSVSRPHYSHQCILAMPYWQNVLTCCLRQLTKQRGTLIICSTCSPMQLCWN